MLGYILSLGRKGLQSNLPQFCVGLVRSSMGPSRTMGSMSEHEMSIRRELNHGAHQDKLLLRGLIFHGKHGVFEEERTLGQKFRVDLDASLDLRKAGETDELEDTVNYAEIYHRVKTIMEGPPHRLLESVATAIASDVLQQFPTISDVRVRIVKPEVAVEGVVNYLGIEIFRRSVEFRSPEATS